MEATKKVVYNILSDVDGNLSSRRVAVFWCLGLLTLELIGYFCGKVPDATITTAITTVSAAAIAGVAADRFGTK